MTNEVTPKNGSIYRVAVYLRVSVEDERNGSHTFETQRARIKEKLDHVYGEGHYTADEFMDNGVSGGYGPEPTRSQKKYRPALRQMKAALQTGSYDALIVYDLSRFTRSPHWLEDLIDDVVEPFELRFISATEGVDLATVEGRSMARVLTLTNTVQRENLKKRIKDAVDTRTSQGYLHGNPGYGWEWEPKANVPVKGRRRILRNEEQGRWVVQIKDWALSGWSTMRIADEMNRLGVPTPSGTGEWAYHSVRNILDNEQHAGYIHPKRGDLQKGEHYDRRYYDLEDYERIQAIRLKRGKRTRTPHAPAELLTNIVRCARCGERLYISLGRKGQHSYRCVTKDANGTKSCPKVTIRGEVLESLVLRQLEEAAQNSEFEREVEAQALAAATEEEERAIQRKGHVQRELSGLDGQFTKWAEMVTKGSIDEEQFAAFNADLRKKQARLKAELAEIEKSLSDKISRERRREQVLAAVQDFPSVWEHLNPDERRGMVALLIDRLAVDREGEEAVVTVKMACLPERTLTTAPLPPKKDRPAGLERLTLRQLAILQHMRMGKTVAQTAEAMGVTKGCVNITLNLIRKHLGYKDVKDLIEVATPRLNQELPNLPMGPQTKTEDEVPVFTAAEQQVWRPLAMGATSKQVAELTGFSKSKVDVHRANILRKLKAKNVFEAVQNARKIGVLP